MTATCAFPGCDKPPRPVPRARYCSWEHLTEAMNRREREGRRKKRTAERPAAKRLHAAPSPDTAVAQAAPLPPRAFADDPKAAADRGSRWMPQRVVYALGASSLAMT